jgi:hypothetical protein
MDDTIINNLVTNIAKEADTVIKKDKGIQGFKRILPSLMEKGLDKVDLSMFSFEMRTGIINSMGEEYIRRGNLDDAQRA